MSNWTYRANDGRVHALSYATRPPPLGEAKQYTWCGASYKVDKDRYVRDVREHPEDVVTCVRCLSHVFYRRRPTEMLEEIFADNSVKDLQEIVDAGFAKDIDATVSASTTSAR